MNYVCVAVNREVVNHQSFSDKMQAVDYFNQCVGAEIRQGIEIAKAKCEKRIENYKIKIFSVENKLQKLLSLSTMENLDLKDEELLESLTSMKSELEEKLELYKERLEKAEKELEELNLDFYKKHVTYNYQVKYSNKMADQLEAWDALLEETPHLMMHLSGIYQMGNVFSVIEEKFSFIGAKRESDTGILGVMKKLPKEFDKNRIYLYVLPEKDKNDNENIPKLLKEISRIHGQLQRNFINSPNRLKDALEVE